MTARIPLLLALLLGVLAACGGGEGPVKPKPGPDTPPPEEGPSGPEPARDVDLDDKTLGELLEAHKRVLAAGDDVRGAMALGQGTRWNYATYAKAMLRWQAMEDAVALGVDGAQKELDQLDKRIAELEAEIAAATGDEKTRLEQTLALTKRMRPALMEHVKTTKGFAAPVYQDLVKRWKPRFDEADAAAKKDG